MLQRGLDYAAATVIICAAGAALLVLTAEILSFSSPVADAAAAVGAAVMLNSLRRRIPFRAWRRWRQKTRIGSAVAVRRSGAPVTVATLWLILWARTCGAHPGRRARWNQPTAGRSRPVRAVRRAES